MAVPSSGELKLYKDIWNDEIGGTQGDNSLHSASVYAGFSAPDAMSDFYGWSDIDPPSVTVYSNTSVTYNSMNLRGCVSNDGGEPVTRGFYFGTNSASATSNPKVTLAGTTSSPVLYCCNKTGLACNRAYYTWAYACNSAGETVTGGCCSSTTPFPPYTPPSGYCYAYACAVSQVYGFQNWGRTQLVGAVTLGYINPYNSSKVSLGNGSNTCPYSTTRQQTLFAHATHPTNNCTNQGQLQNGVAIGIRNYGCMYSCVYQAVDGSTCFHCATMEGGGTISPGRGVKMPFCIIDSTCSGTGITNGGVSQYNISAMYGMTGQARYQGYTPNGCDFAFCSTYYTEYLAC